MNTIIGRLNKDEIDRRIGNYKGNFSEFERESRKLKHEAREALLRFRNNWVGRNTNSIAVCNK